MKSKTLDAYGLPNVTMLEDGTTFYTESGRPIGDKTKAGILATSPIGCRVCLTRHKVQGALFRAPWTTGIKHKRLTKFDLSKYYATVDGRIFGTRNMDYIKPRLTHDGYEYVLLYTDSGDYMPWRVSRLIAMTFIPNPENKDTVDHINNVRNDNRVENLQWVWMWENDDKRRERRGISDDKIREVCKYLESGMSQTEAANAANVGRHIARGIQDGSYYRISRDYNIPRHKYQRRLPVEFRGIPLVPHGQQRRVHKIVIHDSSSTTSP